MLAIKTQRIGTSFVSQGFHKSKGLNVKKIPGDRLIKPEVLGPISILTGDLDTEIQLLNDNVSVVGQAFRDLCGKSIITFFDRMGIYRVSKKSGPFLKLL